MVSLPFSAPCECGLHGDVASSYNVNVCMHLCVYVCVYVCGPRLSIALTLWCLGYDDNFIIIRSDSNEE